MNDSPKISVVTVCYNAADAIERTIGSVINQTYSNIEFIVVDGGSSDCTVNILRKYDGKISKWTSEPDKGIYDAMNKGVEFATGNWIIFMNVGDVFCNNEVLTRISKELDNNYTFIYGNTICDFAGILIRRIPSSLDKIRRYMPFSHQSVFIKSDYHKCHLYDTSFSLVADYDLFYHSYLNGEAFKYVSLDVAIYEAEKGVSSINYKKRCIEYARIHGNSESMFFYSILNVMIIWHEIKHFVKSFMPKCAIREYYRLRL